MNDLNKPFLDNYRDKIQLDNYINVLSNFTFLFNVTYDSEH